MFITKKHLSRRTMLKGAGFATGPAAAGCHDSGGNRACGHRRRGAAAHGLRIFSARRGDEQLGADQHRHRLQDLADPGAAGSVSAVHDHRQRPAQQGRREPVARTPSSPAPGSPACIRRPASSRTSGPSADQVAAKYIGQDTPLPSIELAGEGGGGACDPSFGCSYSGTIAFRTGEQPLPMDNNPRPGVRAHVRAGRYGRAAS